MLETIKAARKHGVVPSIDAMEINMASYAVANLKADIALHGASSQDLNFYLTNTLSARLTEVSLFEEDPISKESARADQAKFDRTHNVVLGNPPYKRTGSDMGILSKPGLSRTHSVSGRANKSLFDDLLEPFQIFYNSGTPHQLYNLYSYFWRWSIYKVFEQNVSGPGVIGFVTSKSWLQGKDFIGLRQLASLEADEIFILDLGGDAIGTRKDENVFPIRTPVCITLMVRRAEPRHDVDAKVNYYRIPGTSRQEKLAYLRDVKFTEVPWKQVASAKSESFIPEHEDSTWQSFPRLVDLLPWQHPGLLFARKWPISPSKDALVQRWQDFTSEIDLDEKARKFQTPKSGLSIFSQSKFLPALVDEPSNSVPVLMRYGYRTFDRQWAIKDTRLAASLRPALLSSHSESQRYLVTKTAQALGAGPGAIVSAEIPDNDFFNGRGGKDVFPLFREPGAANVNVEFVKKLKSDGFVFEETDLFYYCYGVLAGTDYTERFSSQLATPGPKVPVSRDCELFREMVGFGLRLAKLHTFSETDLASQAVARWASEPDFRPLANEIKYEKESLSLHVGSGLLEGVTPSVFDFEVSGMKVINKWLGYRVKSADKKVSSPLENLIGDEWISEWSDQLLEVVAAIEETLRLRNLGSSILDRILGAELFSKDEIPKPSRQETAPPKAD